MNKPHLSTKIKINSSDINGVSINSLYCFLLIRCSGTLIRGETRDRWGKHIHRDIQVVQLSKLTLSVRSHTEED